MTAKNPNNRHTLPFSHNWNGKLYCAAFTSIRLRNDGKYRVGYTYDLTLKGTPGGQAILSQIKHFTLNELTDFMALIDTGYNKQDCTAMIKTMYKKIVTNWETQQFSFMLFRRVQTDKELPTPKEVFSFKDNKAA